MFTGSRASEKITLMFINVFYFIIFFTLKLLIVTPHRYKYVEEIFNISPAEARIE